MNTSRGALGAAYMVAMGWVAYRDIVIHQRPPQPRNIIKGSLLYGLLGVSAPLITDQLAAALGWGLLVATIIRDQGRGPESPDDGIAGLLSPDPGQAPNATTPPPGTPPGTPPYLWNVPDPGSRPTISYYFPGGQGLGRRTISV